MPRIQRSDAPMAFDVQSRQQGRINSSRDCGEIYLASRLPLWLMSYASDKSRGTCPACALEVTTLFVCLFFLVEISLVT